MDAPTFLSVFSGIGGFDLGLERAGWRCIGQIEIDPFCQRVLQRHWPDVPKWDDVRSIRLEDRGEPALAPSWITPSSRATSSSPVDLLCGGFPCQDLSLAGKRAGLHGERSGLFFEFMRLARSLSPRWLLLENVPGLLSSRNGRDFTRLLHELEQSGYWWAYRILDSRWFGVPQRRRRVFIVGHLGGAVPPAILFEPESGQGHSAAGGETGADLAYCLNASVRKSGDGHGNAWNTTYTVTDPLTPKPYADHEAQHRRLVVNALRASDGHPGHSSPRGDGSDNLIVHSLPASAGGRGGVSEDGTGRGVPILAAPLTAGSHDQSHMPGRRREDDENLVLAQNGSDVQVGIELGTIGANQAKQTSGDLVTISPWLMRNSHSPNQFGVKDDGLSDALDSTGGQGVGIGHMVRRLTPLECERLQAFPDMERIAVLRICQHSTEPHQSCVRVDDRSPKLRERAGNAASDNALDCVSCAELDLQQNSQQKSKHAAINVRISSEGFTVRPQIPKNFPSTVNNVAVLNMFPLCMPQDVFVLFAAHLRQRLEKATQHGRVELPMHGGRSLVQPNGMPVFRLSGSEISGLANDADRFTSTVSECLKFITSQDGPNSQNCDWITKTLSLCVSTAIASSIQNITQHMSSFDLVLDMDASWTCLCGCAPYSTWACRCPDSPRYRALGNAVTVSVLTWIGQRLRHWYAQ